MNLRPFSRPIPPWNPTSDPVFVRGALNQIAKKLSGDQVLGVSTTAIALADAVNASAFALVNGDDGAGKAFVDQVAWNGASGTVVAVSSTTVQGAPAARTYTVVSNVLKLAMGSGTYTIQVIPIVFTT